MNKRNDLSKHLSSVAQQAVRNDQTAETFKQEMEAFD